MSNKFHSLKIKDIRKETGDTVSIAITVPTELKSEFAYKAGQYLTFKVNLQNEEVRRSYSICSAPFDDELRVAVKQIAEGAFSTFANQNLKTGDSLETMAPLGNFTVTPDASAAKNHVFFAAGSGITPVLAMVKTLLSKEPQSTIHLFYANKSAVNTIFKNQLDELAAKNQQFKLHYFYTQEDSGKAITNGRIDAAKCGDIHNEFLNGVTIDAIYSCGPQDMIMAVKDYFTGKGVDAKKIHFELFTVTAAPVKEASTSDANVTAKMVVIMDDEEFEFTLATAGKSILQAAQDAGADVPFSCKGGVCCTCKAKVLEGSVKMDLNYALEPDEVEAGFILTCQSHPTSEKVKVSFDEY